jgi:hypothetical protein
VTDLLPLLLFHFCLYAMMLISLISEGALCVALGPFCLFGRAWPVGSAECSAANSTDGVVVRRRLQLPTGH